jgi:hypothetical protein
MFYISHLEIHAHHPHHGLQVEKMVFDHREDEPLDSVAIVGLLWTVEVRIVLRTGFFYNIGLFDRKYFCYSPGFAEFTKHH